MKMFNAEQARDIAEDAMEIFFTTNREVVASSNRDRIVSALVAHIRLNSQDKVMDEVLSLPSTDAGFQEGLKRLSRHLDTVFLYLYDSGRLVLDGPLTSLGQQALLKMRDRIAPPATAIPRGSVAVPKTEVAASAAPVITPSKWDGLSMKEFDQMPARESRALYVSDAAFRAVVDRLTAEQAAANAVHPNTTGKCFIQRRDTKQFLWKFEAGFPVWINEVDHRLGQWKYEDANRYLKSLASQGIAADAYEMDGRLINTDPGKPTVSKRSDSESSVTTSWRFEQSGLTTVRNIRVNPRGTFVLKNPANNEYVASINESSGIVRTCAQVGNARTWSSREAAKEVANSIPLVFLLCLHDGSLDTATHSGS
jgi:hypothetical protein